ncbi:MAG: hypothetical protein J5713_01035 [Clostridia bacterium]|nr:hypothetical protein [Clostridia bacterium]
MEQTANLLDEKSAKDVEAIVNEVVSSFDGLELVELAFKKEYGKLNVTAYIWKKQGIDLADCEAVHNVLSERLDAIESELPETYVLNVSSSGLDRKIVSADDFRRALDTEIEVFILGKDKPHGILKEYDDEKITIILGGKNAGERVIDRKTITKVQPYIRF